MICGVDTLSLSTFKTTIMVLHGFSNGGWESNGATILMSFS